MKIPFYTLPMFARFRCVVMWILLLALPLQGFAAATMINCGANHHRMLAASASAATEVHEHAMSGHHQHEADLAGDMHAAAVDDDEHGASLAHHLDKLTKFKCSACAVCCMGAAMPTAALVIASFPPTMTTALFVSTPHADFVSDGLDRPPRLFLA